MIIQCSFCAWKGDITKTSDYQKESMSFFNNRDRHIFYCPECCSKNIFHTLSNTNEVVGVEVFCNNCEGTVFISSYPHEQGLFVNSIREANKLQKEGFRGRIIIRNPKALEEKNIVDFAIKDTI